jgi:N-ethylmaleimide reductase
MMTKTLNKLFTPVQLGPLTLKHRVVLPPMSRLRAHWPSNVPTDLMRDYYTQRASDGGLVIAEASAVTPLGRSYHTGPGMYTDEQVQGWKKITDSVHAKGAFMFAQLSHAGRATGLANTNGSTPVSPSVDPTFWENKNIVVSTVDGFVMPSPHRALTVDEIHEIVELYRKAAQNAKKAGFDGIEILSGNSHLVEQFLHDSVNKRDDAYGGSIENRVRFLAEILKAVIEVWSADRVGVRVSPSSVFGQVGDSDPRALYGYLAGKLNELGVAYFHVIEPRISGADTVNAGQGPVAAQELGKLFHGPIIAAGGFEPATAEAAIADGTASLISFGRHFIANPDLPRRIEEGVPLNAYDRNTFYAFDEKGYTDYPFYKK